MRFIGRLRPENRECVSATRISGNILSFCASDGHLLILKPMLTVGEGERTRFSSPWSNEGLVSLDRRQKRRKRRREREERDLGEKVRNIVEFATKRISAIRFGVLHSLTETTYVLPSHTASPSPTYPNISASSFTFKKIPDNLLQVGKTPVHFKSLPLPSFTPHMKVLLPSPHNNKLKASLPKSVVESLLSPSVFNNNNNNINNNSSSSSSSSTNTTNKKGSSSSIRGSSVIDSAPMSSSGPAFMGQVFTMCDSSRKGLMGVRAVASVRSFGPLNSLLRPMLKVMGMDLTALVKTVQEKWEGPMFHFYFDKADAAKYVKKLHSQDQGNAELLASIVSSCPLDEAYKYFKGKPSLFQFVAAAKQINIAKKLIRKERGPKAAASFRGVPVFSAANLTIAMATPSGIRWFTPYFFDKRQLDSLVGHSVENYYQELLHIRRLQRHSQAMDGDTAGDSLEDDSDSLLDPPEVGDFMEEMGQGGPAMESAMVKAAEIMTQDCVDSVFLGSKWGRRVAGLQPSFSVIVDSFERRAAVAEAAALAESEGLTNLAAWVKGEWRPLHSNKSLEKGRNKKDEENHNTGGQREDESTSSSLTEEGGVDGRRKTQGLARQGGPFARIRKAWRSFEPIRRLRGLLSDAGLSIDKDEGEEEDSHNGRGKGMRGPAGSSDGESTDEIDPRHLLHPGLTMLGVAVQGPAGTLTDATLQQAMAAAAKDFEEKVRRGESTVSEHGPLFIADLGEPTETVGKQASRPPPEWDGEDL